MFDAKRDIVVDAPADKVFSYLADFTRHRERNDWPNFHLKPVPQPSFGVGSTFLASADLDMDEGPAKFIREETVTEVVPNTRLAFFSTSKPYLADDSRISFDVEPADGGTRATMMYGTILTWQVWQSALVDIAFLTFSPLIRSCSSWSDVVQSWSTSRDGLCEVDPKIRTGG